MRSNGFKWNSRLLGLLLVGVVIAIFSESAQAIPVFARKYKTSCATCHEAYPRLNGVGEAFRLNGYKFADDELYIKDEPVEMGDEAYKRLWPNAIWPSDIPGLPPISITLENDYTYDIGGTKASRSEFNTPSLGKILGAGAFGDNMSAFVELSFERQGAGGGGHHGGAVTAEGTNTDLSGWIQFENLFGKQNLYNIRVGSIGMQEIGLFTHRGHNRFSISNYLYGATIPALTGHNIAFATTGDEDLDVELDGNPFNLHAQPGIELNGFGKRWRYAVGATNGNGNKFNDNNSEKDVYLQLAYKMGGIGFDGSGMGDGDDLGAASDPWRDDSLTLSLFGYYGNAQVNTSEDFESKQVDRFWRIGPGILWRTGDLQLGGGYIFGKNENPFGAVSNGSVDSKSWFVEANYFAKPWLIPYARYESTKFSNLPAAVTTDDEASFPNGIDQSRIVVGTKMLLRANVSLGLEGIFFTDDDREASNDDNSKFIASLRFAF
ncbi:MAG: hypothetical protein FVQ82_06110 [Planctomycetes bacterium]|nr:hypothetical protein [Planctomycetota bacterium]